MLNRLKIDTFKPRSIQNVNSKIDSKIDFLVSISNIEKKSNIKKSFWDKIKNIFKG